MLISWNTKFLMFSTPLLFKLTFSNSQNSSEQTNFKKNGFTRTLKISSFNKSNHNDMKSKLLSKHKNGISQRLNEEENVYIPSNPVYFDFDQQSVSQNQFKQCHVLPNPYNQEIIDHEKEEKSIIIIINSLICLILTIIILIIKNKKQPKIKISKTLTVIIIQSL